MIDAKRIAKIAGLLALLGGSTMAWVYLAGKIREEVREKVVEELSD